ncbi:MAG: hypothetical protein RLZZ57_490 [Pseudomonadota bacterium]
MFVLDVQPQPSSKLQDFNPRHYEPASFLDRGVALPFTTPLLFGARARAAGDHSGLEVIIANPSGGKGVYILPWAAIPQICVPTLHDRRLWRLLRDKKLLTPLLMREAAEAAALENLAGRNAALAAEAARVARRTREKNTNFALLLHLIKQSEEAIPGRPPPELDEPQLLKQRSQRAVIESARQLQLTTEAVADALEEVSKAYIGFGLPSDEPPAPSRLLLEELGIVAHSITAWQQELPAGLVASAAGTLLESLQLTLSCARQAAAECDALLCDIVALLGNSTAKFEGLNERLARLDWVLDGWDLILGIWQATPMADKAHAIMEMSLLVPVLPKQITEWFGIHHDFSKTRRNASILQQFEAWRSGRLVDLIARNEKLIHRQGQRLPAPMNATRQYGKTNLFVGVEKPSSMSVNFPGSSSRISKPLPKNRFSETRQLVHALAAASDSALTHVVEILDRLPDRQEADRLLDAARPRLRQLRPARRLQLTRLLFLPLDGAIVDNKEWQRGDVCLPRCALPGIAEAVRLAMGEEAARLEAGIAGKTYQDLGVVDRTGRALWAAVASHAPKLKPGPRWKDSGLRPDDFAPLLRMATEVWQHAGALWAAIQLADWGPPEEAIKAALAPLAEAQNTGFAIGLATLMQKATSPGTVALVAAGLSDRAGSIADAAVDDWLEKARIILPTENLIEAANFAEAFKNAFQDLENAPPSRNSNRAERLVQLRQDAEVSLRLAYEQGLEAEIFQQIPSLCRVASPDQITHLESQARALSRIELIGRRFGMGHGYDGAAKRILMAISEAKQSITPEGLTKLDLARIAEILLGPDMALDVLD